MRCFIGFIKDSLNSLNLEYGNMIDHKNFTFGTSVKVEYRAENQEYKKVYAKVICSNFKDEQIYSCITPHGSIIKVHHSNLNALNDDEYQSLKAIEQSAIETKTTLYNNLFSNNLNTGTK